MVRNWAIKTYITIVLVIFATPALAYIDPGSGAMLVQGLLALIATVIFYFRNPKQLWAALRKWFRERRK